MEQPGMFEDSFEDSLRSLAPRVPVDVKSRLLFECGVAAAESRIRGRRRMQLAISTMALLAAVSLGVVLGNQLSQETSQMAGSEGRPVVEEVAPQLTCSTFVRGRSDNMLVVAMAPSEVQELLDRVDRQDQFGAMIDLTVEEPRFGLLSSAGELE